MKVYPLNKEERDQLVALNQSNIIWAASWYGDPVNGYAIEEDTLNDTDFKAHKTVFERFPPRDPVEVVVTEEV